MIKSYKKIISTILIVSMLFSNITYTSTTVYANDNFSFSFFGASTSEENNLAPKYNDDGTVTMAVLSGGGKINSSADKRPDGMSFLYKEVPADKDFVLSAKVKLKSQMDMTKTQESFGLMLRSGVETGEEDYVALGLDPISKNGKFAYLEGMGGTSETGYVEKVNPYNNLVFATGTEFSVEIKKSGNTYNYKVDDGDYTYNFAKSLGEHNFENSLFAGFYIARSGELTLSDYKLDIIDSVEKIEITKTPSKTNYLINEDLDTTDLTVTYDGKELESDEYFISGFDSSKAGKYKYLVNYNGATAEVPYSVSNLRLTKMEVSYLPIKTEYFIGDKFSSEGLVVNGIYDNGYESKILPSDSYEIKVDETKNNEFISSGKKKVTIKDMNTTLNTSFYVNVSDAKVDELVLTEKPVKTEYFLNEEVSTDGLVVTAVYDNSLKLTLNSDEYSIKLPATDKAGEFNIVVTYKGKDLLIPIKVKEKAFDELVVSTYPKTTFNLGEAFTSENLAISLKYDNGDLEAFDSANYIIDSESFDNTKVGTYDIKIKVANSNYENIEDTSYKVTVRETPNYTFDFTRFGQSTREENNTIKFNDDKKSFVISATGNSGKVTSDQDGVGIYYTKLDALKDNFVLTANVKVTQFGKDNSTWDSQEFYGLMARDVNGVNNDASVFYSNIAALGGKSNKTSETPSTQLFIRTGIDDVTGANSEGLTSVVADSKRPVVEKDTYKLTLSKTNDGFIGKVDDNEEVKINADKILSVLSNDMFVGLTAARNATMEVSDFKLETSSAETDKPATAKEEAPIEPVFYVSSQDKTSDTDYNLVAYSNMNGKLTVKQGSQTLVYEKEVTENSKTFVNANLSENSKNTFTLIFTPSYNNVKLTSYNDIVCQFTVENRVIQPKGNIYVCPEGVPTNDGSIENTVDLQTAIDFVQKGQEIIMLDGEYKFNNKIEVSQYNDGQKDKMKTLRADDDAKVVVNFNGVGEGFALSGNYWHVKNIEFTNSRVNIKGFNVGGSNNIVELCKFYANGDTGLQISRTIMPELAQNINEWPSNNLILNCESYDNHDPAENNADGFANKLTSGYGNVFRGCVAHNNTDDGYDFFTKANSGAIGPVTVENCVAYDNGTLTNGHETKADSNGFKLGGEGIAVPHVIQNSISFNNKGSGISSNSNPALIIKNCVAFDNRRCNINYSSYTNATLSFVGENILSFYTDDFAYTKQTDVHPGVNNETTYFYDEEKDLSTNVNGDKIELSTFVKPTIPVPRENNGNVIKDYFDVK